MRESGEMRKRAPVRTLVDFLVEPLKGPPRVKVVPEVVEALNLGLGRLHVSKRRDGLLLGKAALESEDGLEDLNEVLGFYGRGSGNVVVDGLVGRVELPAAL